ncbi:MAG: acetylornithine deacetylase [Pseudomonadota bacterium]
MAADRHAQHDAARDILTTLVGFDTVSRNSNLPLIDWVEQYLDGHGIASVRTPDETGEKANLFATIGPEGVPGVGLSGHTDVVPVDGQDWDTDPFKLTAKDGKLYGRGACDMKGYLACVLAAVPLYTQRNLQVPIHVVFSYDEEIGCLGVLPMIDRMGRDLVKPRIVFVGEPTEMTVVDAHKGPCRWTVELKGKAVHSSLAHQGVNTITYAGRLLAKLDQMEHAFKAKPNPRFDPPYTTLQVTQLEAGRATNIVPENCWFGWEIRGIPGADAEAVEREVREVADALAAEMREIDPDAGIELKRSHSVPPFLSNPDREALPLALRLAETNETFAVAYATEASHFETHNMPTVVCGPGNIAQAHTPNEWIEETELSKCLAFLDRLGDWCADHANATARAA